MAKSKKEVRRNQPVQGRREPAERLLTVADVAQRLSVSTKTIYRLRADGEIGHVRVGGSLRFRLQDLADYESRKHVSGHRYPRREVDNPVRLNLKFEVKKRGRGPRRR
jgi:excisionase family DNA binding protein